MAQHTVDAEEKKQLRERFAVTEKTWNLYSRTFTRAMALLVKYVHVPVLGDLLKKLVMMNDNGKNRTQSYTFNLNYKLGEKQQIENVILPVDIIRETIVQSEYRAIMHKCLCRTGEDCQNYRKDLGCIFLGKGAVATVKNGVAREATVEEALNHLEKATGLGLAGMGMWIEVENYVWGIKKEQHTKWLEICFCCPCCCIALQHIKNVGPDIQKRFRHMGWQAAYTGGCTVCGVCETACPAGAISILSGEVTIADKCLGCGICTTKCPANALEIQMVSHKKSETIQGFFTGFKPEL